MLPSIAVLTVGGGEVVMRKKRKPIGWAWPAAGQRLNQRPAVPHPPKQAAQLHSCFDTGSDVASTTASTLR